MRDQDVVQAGEKSPHEEEGGDHCQRAAVVLGSLRGADGIRTLLGSWCHAHLWDLDVRDSRNCIPPQLHAQQKSSTNRSIGRGAAGVPNERRLCACRGGSSRHYLNWHKECGGDQISMDGPKTRAQGNGAASEDHETLNCPAVTSPIFPLDFAFSLDTISLPLQGIFQIRSGRLKAYSGVDFRGCAT